MSFEAINAHCWEKLKLPVEPCKHVFLTLFTYFSHGVMVLCTKLQKAWTLYLGEYFLNEWFGKNKRDRLLVFSMVSVVKMQILWPHCHMCWFSGSGCDPGIRNCKQALFVRNYNAVILWTTFWAPLRKHWTRKSGNLLTSKFSKLSLAKLSSGYWLCDRFWVEYTFTYFLKGDFSHFFLFIAYIVYFVISVGTLGFFHLLITCVIVL